MCGLVGAPGSIPIMMAKGWRKYMAGAIVRYLVASREAGRVKTRLIKKLLAALNAAPDKVMFAAGAAR
jgi:hypothetical protein